MDVDRLVHITTEGFAVLTSPELQVADQETPAVNGGDTADSPPGAPEALIGRKRFTKVSAWAAGIVTVPYLWILWILWGNPSLLHHTPYEDNFFDLQARAMMAGHLSVPNGSLGIEGFFHAGREYTYFGIFPSLIRMPILLLGHMDGKLDSPALLTAWLLAAVTVPLLLWRVRCLTRGHVPLGWSEAVAYGFLTAACLGGTVMLQLAANPFVFSEDLAWSISLALAGIFLLLGILERPTRRQVWLALAVILAANLNRVTTGWALAGAAILIALYFALGFGGMEKKQWALKVLAVGLVPLAVGCAVNYAKFGMLFGVSNFAQEWTRVNVHRRQFLAANHNSESGTAFIPTTVLTYFRPDGIHLSSVFPFVTLPTGPPKALGGVLFDRLYRTPSIPSSMPLTFLLGCWGMITAFRPRSVGRVHLTRILLLGTAGSGILVLGWGYIADRYLADYVPFFVLAAAVGMADLWRRMQSRRAGIRRAVLVIVAALGTFSVVANIGIAIAPADGWTSSEALRFVQTQKSISDVTGHPLTSDVRRGENLPAWAPAGQLYVVGDCAGLYVSNGEDYSTVPAQQYSRATWTEVELGTPFLHVVRASFGPTSVPVSAEMVSVGPDVISVTTKPSSIAGIVLVRFTVTDLPSSIRTLEVPERVGSTHPIQIVTDTAKHVESVSMDGLTYVTRTLTNDGPIETHFAASAPSTAAAPLSIAPETTSAADAPLCRSLVG